MMDLFGLVGTGFDTFNCYKILFVCFFVTLSSSMLHQQQQLSVPLPVSVQYFKTVLNFTH